MKRFLPKSLLGQVMASAMLALLVAQLVGAFFLFKAGEDRLELAALSALTFQLSIGGDNPERFAPRTRPAERGDRAERRRAPGARTPPEMEFPQPVARLPRHLRYRTSDGPAVALSEENTDTTRAERLAELLGQEGIRPAVLAIEVRRAGTDPDLLAFAATRPRLDARTGWRKRNLYVASVQREPGGPWETVRAFERQPPKQAFGVLIFQTILIYAFLGTILFLTLRRITRPLAQLTRRVDDFSKAPDKAVLLDESGPADMRQLIRAHNAMEARIAALLDEKDVMLGAIGHDLKTPLAALRVRIESVPDEAQRERMADSIEDITRTLDDILSLARVGKSNGGADPFEAVDITALADSVVEEFEDLGDPVTLETPEAASPRLVASVQVTWLKRALRNLISNAVRYGGAASVSVYKENDALSLRVDDNGPGIPDDQIVDMLEPFTRGDASRNRSTGGTGLGLTLARAIAEAHGGELVLTNRTKGGLRAEIRLVG
ncbi:MAG: ATP-binding protein [Pseudomonadota bacterium]